MKLSRHMSGDLNADRKLKQGLRDLVFPIRSCVLHKRSGLYILLYHTILHHTKSYYVGILYTTWDWSTKAKAGNLAVKPQHVRVSGPGGMGRDLLMLVLRSLGSCPRAPK